jgi:hypothetical protein
MSTDISEERVPSIFRAEKLARNQHEALLATCFMLVSCLTYSPAMKMEAKYSSETSVCRACFTGENS